MEWSQEDPSFLSCVGFSLDTRGVAQTYGQFPRATTPDAGHWWMCSHPEQAASILIEHWANFES